MLVVIDDFTDRKGRRALNKNCSILDLAWWVRLRNKDGRAKADVKSDNKAELGVEGTYDMLELGKRFAKP